MLCGLAVPCFAWADDSGSSTQTLSGSIGDITIDESITTVVLNGVTAEDGTKITIKGSEVELVVQSGTQNTVAGLEATGGSLHITGSGSLNADHLYVLNTATFDYEGTLTIKDGSILTTSGDLIFNSGTYNVSGTEASSYALASLTGSIYLNGGTFTLHGLYSAIRSGAAAVVLAGGTLNATSEESAAVMSGEKLSNGITIGSGMKLADGLTVKDFEDDEGETVSALYDSNGNMATTVTAKGSAVAQGSVTADGASYVSAASKSSSTGITPGRIVLIVAACAALAAAVAAGVVAVRRNNKRHKVTGKHV